MLTYEKAGVSVSKGNDFVSTISCRFRMCHNIDMTHAEQTDTICLSCAFTLTRKYMAHVSTRIGHVGR